jgi:hypothetical protein
MHFRSFGSDLFLVVCLARLHGLFPDKVRRCILFSDGVDEVVAIGKRRAVRDGFAARESIGRHHDEREERDRVLSRALFPLS